MGGLRDVYRTLPPFGSNSRVIDEEDLGLVPGFFGDDLVVVRLPSGRTVTFERRDGAWTPAVPSGTDSR